LILITNAIENAKPIAQIVVESPELKKVVFLTKNERPKEAPFLV
jgi:hypothetical protein